MINQFTDLELLQINAEDVAQLPNIEHEFINAKCFLQKGSNASGDNLYDHLTDVLNKILAERPENVVDFFEEYSRKVKERRYKNLTDHLEDIYVPPGKYRVANRLMPLLKPLAPGAPSTVDPEDLELADMSKNNMLELLYYFEHAGLGLPRTDMFCLTMTIRQLIHSEPIASVRFWGKIFGLYKDYIIVEAELKDEAYISKNELANLALEEAAAPPAEPPPEAAATDVVQNQLEDIAKMQAMGGEDAVVSLWESLPPEPPNLFEETPEAPSEIAGVGLNKKVYYVCNEIGEPWVLLPDITPKQIRVSRQIYRQFTGNLDQEIITYPVFPGTERNYLRAQIARISASTHISPLGFYGFGGEDMGEEEEMDEEEPDAGNKTEVKENLKYDPLPMKELTDKSMMFWVHHNPFILNQGRITWWNPNPLPEGLDEEMGEEEEDEKPIIMGPEPETGPPLLTPCSEDVTLDAIPAWSVRCSSAIAEEYSVAIVRSNFWPGAYCFATHGKLFQNVYFGSGLKFLAPNFSPVPLPNVQQDYPIGPEIMEIVDPTGAEEEEWRIAHLPKEKPPKMPEDEEIEEEDEDEDEDDDD